MAAEPTPCVVRVLTMGGALQVNAAHGLVEVSAPTLGQARRSHAAGTPLERARCTRSAPPLRPLIALCATPNPHPHRSPHPSARAGLCVAGGDRTLSARLPRAARHAARARDAAAAAGQRRRPRPRRGAARHVSAAAHRRHRGASPAGYQADRPPDQIRHHREHLRGHARTRTGAASTLRV
jgi:hypothetical protein